jgi:hypothetical protein
MIEAGNTKGGSITVPLASCLTGLEKSVLQIKTKIVSWHTSDFKPVKQEVNSTVILSPLVVFPDWSIKAGNTKQGIITVPLTSCLTGSDKSVLQIKTKIVSCPTADSKPVKQEVNGTLILPSLVFPDWSAKVLPAKP